ncbi:hypothetical protein ABK040_006477 [Willaertia magna]
MSSHQTSSSSNPVELSSDDESFYEEENLSQTDVSEEEEEESNLDDTEEIVIVDDDFYDKYLSNASKQEQAQIIQKNINSTHVQFLHTVTPMNGHFKKRKVQDRSKPNRITKQKKTLKEPSGQPVECFLKNFSKDQLIKYQRFHNLHNVTSLSEKEDLENAAMHHFKDEWKYINENNVINQLLFRLECAIPGRLKQ